MEDNIQQAPEQATQQEAPIQEQSTVADIKQLLSEDLREDPSLQDFKDVNALAKSYVNAQRMIGSSIRIPTEDAGEEQRNEFYEKLTSVPGVARLPKDENDKSLYHKLGLPQEPKDYNIEIDGISQDALQPYYEQFYERNLTKNQAEAVIDMYMDMQAQAQESQQMGKEGAEKVLREKWGQDYDNRMAGAKAVIQSYNEKYPDHVQSLVNGPAGNNPAFIAMLSELGGSLQEKGSPQFKSSVKYGMSSEEAMEKISEIRGNPDHPVHNDADPNHKEAVKKLTRLYEIAFPS